MKTEHGAGETPCILNGFWKTEFLIWICHFLACILFICCFLSLVCYNCDKCDKAHVAARKPCGIRIFKDLRQIAVILATICRRKRRGLCGWRLTASPRRHPHALLLGKIVINDLIQLVHAPDHRHAHRLGYASVKRKPANTTPPDMSKCFHPFTAVPIK